jgi:transcriptional regulator
MHPNRAFAWDDEAEMLDFVRRRAFAHIFASGAADGGRIAHAPLHVTDDGRVQFHLFVNNPAAAGLADQPVLISVTDLDGYQSANWYVSADQVPTWHYQAVEIDGIARRLDQDGLIGLLDAFTAEMERRFSPENPWTRAKMSPGKFEALTKAITGFELDGQRLRGTLKFNQHKPEADIQANLRGQRQAGRPDLAEATDYHWRRRREL